MCDLELYKEKSDLESLSENVEDMIAFACDVGSQAFVDRNYERIKKALDRAVALASFKDRLDALNRDWLHLMAAYDEEQDENLCRTEEQTFIALRETKQEDARSNLERELWAIEIMEDQMRRAGFSPESEFRQGMPEDGKGG